MEKLDYFEIGWNSASTVRELENLKNKKNYNENLIKNYSYPIICNCEKLLNFKLPSDEFAIYEKFFPEQFPEKPYGLNLKKFNENFKKIQKKVQEIKDITKKVKDCELNSKKDLESAIYFFLDLSKKCILLGNPKKHYYSL